MPELKTDEQKQDEQEGNTILLEDYLGSDRFAEQLKQILPEALDSDRFSTIAFRQIRLVPNLNLCDLASVAGAIMQAGSLGLEIATQGECWVIPRERPRGSGKFEANLQIGYLGHLALMWRSTQVAGLCCDVVHSDDKFSYRKGTDGFLHHEPKEGRIIEESTVRYAYAVVQTIYGGTVWDVVDHVEIERLRSAGPSGNSPAWKTWYDKMAMGKALRAAVKFCPKSREQGRAIALDEQSDAGVRQDLMMDLPALPAEVTGSQTSRNVDEALRRSAQTPKETERDEPSPSDQMDINQDPQDQREPVEAETTRATVQTGKPVGTLGF